MLLESWFLHLSLFSLTAFWYMPTDLWLFTSLHHISLIYCLFHPCMSVYAGGLEIQEQKLKNAWPFAWGPPRILSCDRPNPPKPRGPSRRKAFVGRARRLGGKSFFLTVIHTGRWAHVPVGRASLAAKFGLWRDGSWTEGLASSIVSWMDWPLQWYCNCR